MTSFARFPTLCRSQLVHKCINSLPVVCLNYRTIASICSVNHPNNSNGGTHSANVHCLRYQTFSTNQQKLDNISEDNLENLKQSIDLAKRKFTSKDIIFQESDNRKVEYENLFIYNALKNTKEYDEKVVSIIRRVSGKASMKWPSNITEFLFEANSATEQVDDLVKQIKNMNLSDVIHFQNYLIGVIPVNSNHTEHSEWDKIYYKSNFYTIWKTLDYVSTGLLKNLPLDRHLYEMIAISSLWYELELDRRVVFNSTLIDKLLRYNRNLDKSAFLYLMFSLNLKRSLDSHHKQAVLSSVDLFLNTSQNITLDELAIIGLGFFKTQTMMSNTILPKFIKLCIEELSRDSCQADSITTVAILKSIRYALTTFEFDAIYLNGDINTMIELLCSPKYNLLDSNIGVTHLILLLNSAFLHKHKRLYKAIFDKMISDLPGFRIKDIDRILYCLSNASFKCPASKFKTLENYLLKSKETQNYSYHIYNITGSMMILDYYPPSLIRLCKSQDFLSKSIKSFKNNLHNMLLIVDTILRLERKQRILTQDQIYECHKSTLMELPKDFPKTKRGRFSHSITSILSDHFGDKVRLMYLLPFSGFPFITILSKETVKKLPPANTSILEAHPYTYEHMKLNYFQKSAVILPLLAKDRLNYTTIRGFIDLNIRLLEKMGFKVIFIEQKDYPNFAFPDHLKMENPARNDELAKSLLDAINVHIGLSI